MIPVYIPSKGRPKCPTARLVKKAIIVVEPQDYESYKANFPDHEFWVLSENDKGLSNTRNTILELGRQAGHKWIWMLDDDIKHFVTYAQGSSSNVSWETISGNLDPYLESRPEIGQAAIEYSQLAWNQVGDKKCEYGYCDVAVAINIEATRDLSYRPYVVLKEDRDFTLQILRKGFKTVRFVKYAFIAPKNGSNRGGLYDLYHQKDRELLAVQRMMELWGPDICKLHVKKDGRTDVKINWKYFKR